MSPTLPIRERRGYAYYDTVTIPAGIFEAVMLFEGRTAGGGVKSLVDTNMNMSTLSHDELFTLRHIYVRPLKYNAESDLYQLKNDCFLTLCEGFLGLQELPAHLAFGDGYRCDVPIPIRPGAPLRVRISPTCNVIIAEPVRLQVLLGGDRER